MKRGVKERMVRIIGSTAFLIIILAWMFAVGYIDASVALAVYLPVWLVSVAAALMGQVVFARVMTAFAGVGLAAEYLVHLLRGPRPSMSGAFLNIMFLGGGLILGILLQVLSRGQRRRSHDPLD